MGPLSSEGGAGHKGLFGTWERRQGGSLVHVRAPAVSPGQCVVGLPRLQGQYDPPSQHPQSRGIQLLPPSSAPSP